MQLTVAERAGLLGLSFTNGSPWVTATRSAGARVMSTNPVSFTAPATGQVTSYWGYPHISTVQDSLVLDMATATVAVGKLEVAAVNKQQIPGGWAVDGRGRQTQARAFTRQGHLVTVHTCHVSRVTCHTWLRGKGARRSVPAPRCGRGRGCRWGAGRSPAATRGTAWRSWWR